MSDSRCPLCHRLGRTLPTKRLVTTRAMTERWQSLWSAALGNKYPFWAMRRATEAEWPGDLFYGAEHCSDSRYFNLGMMITKMLWNEVYQNGF